MAGDMAKANAFTRVAMNTMANGSMTCYMVKVNTFIKTVVNTKAILLMAR